MSFSLDVSTSPFRLRVEGCLSTSEVEELSFRLRTQRSGLRRPPLLINAQQAEAVTLLWNKTRRSRLETLLQQVGPVAIVTAAPDVLGAVKLALHPSGSDVVWRTFTNLEDATAWLERVETHGQRIWNPDSVVAPVANERLDRLLHIVLARA